VAVPTVEIAARNAAFSLRVLAASLAGQIGDHDRAEAARLAATERARIDVEDFDAKRAAAERPADGEVKPDVDAKVEFSPEFLAKMRLFMGIEIPTPKVGSKGCHQPTDVIEPDNIESDSVEGTDLAGASWAQILKLIAGRLEQLQDGSVSIAQVVAGRFLEELELLPHNPSPFSHRFHGLLPRHEPNAILRRALIRDVLDVAIVVRISQLQVISALIGDLGGLIESQCTQDDIRTAATALLSTGAASMEGLYGPDKPEEYRTAIWAMIGRE
jgi:hypothetical protein